MDTLVSTPATAIFAEQPFADATFVSTHSQLQAKPARRIKLSTAAEIIIKDPDGGCIRVKASVGLIRQLADAGHIMRLTSRYHPKNGHNASVLTAINKAVRIESPTEFGRMNESSLRFATPLEAR